MYVLVNGNDALVIDPHEDSDIENLLFENNIRKVTILLTHEHPDHIDGVYWLQQQFESLLVCQEYCAWYISQLKNVRPTLLWFVLQERDAQNGTHLLDDFNNEFVLRTYIADVTYSDFLQMNWKGHHIELTHILGHSKGSSLICLDSQIVFTGDTLLKEMPIITRFQGGSKKKLVEETIPYLENKLTKDTFILPGHGEIFKFNEILKEGHINVQFR